MKISCVIPIHNEEKLIPDVLSEVIKVKNISEIICVDDGSTDMSASLVKNFSQIKLIQLQENLGKVAAVRKGVETAVGDMILVMDADLRNLNAKELDTSLSIAKDSNLDMVIFRRINIPKWMKFTRAGLLITGERLIRKEDFLKILSADIRGFELEIAINHYMLSNKKKVKWIASTATNVFKIKKYGWLIGVYKEIVMFLQIFILNLGFIKYNYLRQFIYLGTEELK